MQVYFTSEQMAYAASTMKPGAKLPRRLLPLHMHGERERSLALSIETWEWGGREAATIKWQAIPTLSAAQAIFKV